MSQEPVPTTETKTQATANPSVAKQYVAPVIIIMIGTGWLLNVQGIIPEVDWVWTCGLASGGILSLLIGGFHKLPVVTGLFLLIASFSSFLRQIGCLSIDQEVPILTIVLGVLLFAVNVFKVPDSALKAVNDQQSKH